MNSFVEILIYKIIKTLIDPEINLTDTLGENIKSDF